MTANMTSIAGIIIYSQILVCGISLTSFVSEEGVEEVEDE
jgi:hypothetical protein